ncbi:MAG: hypothetical protein IJR14_07880 [Synergistaceae bacterium]|nr:hypothetical protein [Synergistaceae bacterium]
MRKELSYVRIEGSLGGSQDWLRERDMHRGGCAAVTACDLCIHLALHDGSRCLYPYDVERLDKESFIRFAQDMKPYLAPRYHGVDFLEIYLCGLSQYWHDTGYAGMRAEGLAGSAPFSAAEEAIRSQLDAGLPIPYLMLYHQDPALGDLEWHWFNLIGYEDVRDGLLVEVVTYGEPQWIGLRQLWETGEERRGGLIRLQRRGVPMDAIEGGDLA